MAKVLFFSLVMLHAALCLSAQIPDTVQLKQIEISSSPILSFSAGSVNEEINAGTDRTAFENQIGSILPMTSQSVIRSASYGSSSSLSLRGSSPGQVAITWNGFNINSPSLGSTDISLIPLEAGNEINLYSSGMSPHSGQTGLGGLLELNYNSESASNSLLSLSTSYGEFNTLTSKGTLRLRGKKLISETNLFYQGSDNDYTYNNISLSGAPEESLQNAKYYSTGIIQNFNYSIDDRNELQAGIWFQRSNREIPAPMTIPLSRAEQRDSSLRTYVRYTRTIGSYKPEISIAYFDEFQVYKNPDAQINSSYKNKQYHADVAVTKSTKKQWLFKVGFKPEIQKADIEEYNQKRSNEFYALYGNILKQYKNSSRVSLSVRKVFSRDYNAPVTASIGIKQNVLWQKLFVLLNGGIHYRIPSLNDRYWIPGGNPDLNAEESKNAELNFVYSDKVKKMVFELNAGTYYRYTDNWIQWTPLAASGLWEPVNLKSVQSSGFNIGGTISIEYKKERSIKFGLSYLQTNAINKAVEVQSLQIIEEKQLPFVPIHSANARVEAQFQNWNISSLLNFSGPRYTLDDNEKELSQYVLQDLILSYKIEKQKFSLRLIARVNNLWDEDYMLQAFVPTRGRWIQGGVQLAIDN